MMLSWSLTSQWRTSACLMPSLPLPSRPVRFPPCTSAAALLPPQVNYRALPDPVWSESAVGAGTPAAGWEAPVSPMEKLVAAVLRRVLHPAGSPGWAQPVGATDGFVELGGSSLQASKWDRAASRVHSMRRGFPQHAMCSMLLLRLRSLGRIPVPLYWLQLRQLPSN